MRRWLARRLLNRRDRRADTERETMEPLEPVRLSESLRGLEGKWAAIQGGVAVAAADTPYALYAELHSKKIQNTTIIRVPAEDEPELVGMG